MAPLLQWACLRGCGGCGDCGTAETAWKVSTPSGSFLVTGHRVGIAAAIAGAALIGLAAGRSLTSSESAPDREGDPRHDRAPAGLELDGVGAPEIAISPDGSTLAFLARGESGPQQLYVRRLDSDEARLVPGSETAEGPFFSPDGKWVAFAVGVSGLGGGVPRELRKQSLESGLTQTIAPIQDYFGGVWRDDGTIFFIDATDGTVSSVPASGGKPTLAAARESDRGEPRSVSLFWPELLPDGGALVLSTLEHPGGELAVLDLGSGVLTRLGVHGMSPRYLPTGHLAFGGESGSLEVVPFDAEERRILGAPVAMLAGIARARNRSATFAVATDGTLVYATGYLSNSRHEPMRVVRASRGGLFETLAIEPDLFGRALAATPDGRRLALAREDRGAWVVDLARGTRTRVAGDEVTGAMDVAWSADGDQLAWIAKPPRRRRRRRARSAERRTRSAAGARRAGTAISASPAGCRTAASWSSLVGESRRRSSACLSPAKARSSGGIPARSATAICRRTGDSSPSNRMPERVTRSTSIPLPRENARR